MDQQLPSGFRPLLTQVAGHTFQTDALGMLQDDSPGCVLKPMGKPACGERELAFYEALQNSGEPLLAQLRPLVPKFHHTLKLVINNRLYSFLKLEDLTYGLRKPCVMDVKVGKRTWDPEASQEKRDVEELKYQQCKQVLGLCVPGFQLYPAAGGELKRYGKDYGKQLDAAGFRDTIAMFLNVQPEPCLPLVQEVLKQLYALRRWFKLQTLYHFYASSLLICYDFESMQEMQRHINGNLRSKDQRSNMACEAYNHTTQQDHSAWVRVRMIDFAHVFPAESGSLDTNYLYGLENLILTVEELLIG